MRLVCPECSATEGCHGSTDYCECSVTYCDGVLCMCSVDRPDDHGSEIDPCPTARCYHCGWRGELRMEPPE